MTIESATYIGDLNASYPGASDAKSEGDDHIRLIKSVLKATFPSWTSGAKLTLNGAYVLTATLTGATNVTFPTSGTLATKTGSETLTNKTLTNEAHTDQTLSDGATINWDCDSGGIATVTLGGNRTMAAPSNLKKGVYILVVNQDGTGGRTLTWNSVFKWPGGVAPTLSTAASAKDIISFYCDGTNLYGTTQKAFA